MLSQKTENDYVYVLVGDLGCSLHIEIFEGTEEGRMLAEERRKGLKIRARSMVITIDKLLIQRFVVLE